MKEAWGSFLGRYEWHAFLTVTFRDPRHPWHAESTLREIQKVIRYSSKGRVFLGSELHVNRTLHVHGLLSLPRRHDAVATRVTTHAIWRDLLERFGRSQVRTVQSNEAVSIYVSKYCVKDLSSWLMS